MNKYETQLQVMVAETSCQSQDYLQLWWCRQRCLPAAAVLAQRPVRLLKQRQTS
jgi:hypothetical protein